MELDNAPPREDAREKLTTVADRAEAVYENDGEARERVTIREGEATEVVDGADWIVVVSDNCTVALREMEDIETNVDVSVDVGVGVGVGVGIAET